MKKRQKKIFFTISLICMLVVGVVYSTAIITPSKEFRRFGVTYMTMNNPFYEIINNEIKKEVDSRGDKLMTLDPALNVEKQKQQIQYFIDEKVDGIFINPVDSKEIEEELQSAKDHNIPVIAIDAPIYNSDLVISTVVSDNYNAGVLCALDMMSQRQSADIILLKHTTVQSAEDRIKGFKDTIKSNSSFRIVNEGECEGQLELAMPLMEKLIKETKHFDVVMALNDPSALGAIAALKNSSKTDVSIYGVDGTPDMKTLMSKDKMISGTVAQSPIQIGQKSIQIMYEYLEGTTVEKDVIVPVVLINDTNIKDYDMDGWQ